MLARYRRPGLLLRYSGSCLPPEPCGEVTIEEIDHTLDLAASTRPSSSIKIRNKAGRPDVDASDELVKIFRLSHNIEAKWMICLLLKGLRLAEMPETSAI